MTIDKIYYQYIPTKEITLSAKTVGSYKSAYAKHIAPVFGDRDINTIHFIDYQKFADNLLLSGLAPKTVKNFLKFISSIYTFAIKNDWYQGQVYPRLVELPKFDNKFYVSFSPAIQKKYLMAVKNFNEPIYKDMFLFLLHGRRLGEVLNLEWQYLDLNQGVVYYPATHNKSRKHLSFSLTTELLNVLKVYHSQAQDHQKTIFVTGHVFINPNTGNKFSNLTKPWKRLLKNANLDYTKLHNIRHILGTYLVNELKLPLETVSYVLGHSDTAITKRYVNIKPQTAKNAIDILFNDFKSEFQKYAEKLNQAIELGECVQKVLFPSEELKTVNIRH